MLLSGNTILVTGGASGIGLAFAERFLQAGNHLIVCGRRESKLAELKRRHPAIETHVCDVADPREREALAKWAGDRFPALNVLVDNAGIQRRVRIAEEQDWAATHQEIAINLEAQVHLTMLLLPKLLKQSRAAIMKVTSGLSFVPLAATPIYCASVNVNEFADAAWQQLGDGSNEVSYGFAQQSSRASREQFDEIFARINARG